ncbi:MAG: RNA polymerase sigma factor [Duganella sp.]
MNECRGNDVVDWLTIHFLPHEAELRRMLRRVCGTPAAVDDAIQETCFRLLSLPSLAHVRDPKPFVFRSAKNIVLDGIRRDATVDIAAMADLEALDIADGAPSPERVVLARTELQWVIGLVGRLPRRCKHVFRARRLHGLSQQETAHSLGLTDSVVEHEMTKAMRLMADMVARDGAAAPGRPGAAMRGSERGPAAFERPA